MVAFCCLLAPKFFTSFHLVKAIICKKIKILSDNKKLFVLVTVKIKTILTNICNTLVIKKITQGPRPKLSPAQLSQSRQNQIET